MLQFFSHKKDYQSGISEHSGPGVDRPLGKAAEANAGDGENHPFFRWEMHGTVGMIGKDMEFSVADLCFIHDVLMLFPGGSVIFALKNGV